MSLTRNLVLGHLTVFSVCAWPPSPSTSCLISRWNAGRRRPRRCGRSCWCVRDRGNYATRGSSSPGCSPQGHDRI